MAEEEISIDEFHRMELATAKVVECEKVQKSRNLLKIIVDVDGVRKQVISSISDYYNPEDMIGKTIIIINNLKRARFMGLDSEAMLLSAENDQTLSLLTTDKEMPSGIRIK